MAQEQETHTIAIGNTIKWETDDIPNDFNVIEVYHENARCSHKCLQSLCRIIRTVIPILHPFGTLKRWWNLLIVSMLIYSCIEIPITMNSQIHVHSSVCTLSMVTLAIDIFLFIDIILTFRTAPFFKYDQLKLEHNVIKIAQRYLYGWFLLDVATTIPWQLFLKNIIVLSAFRSLKLIRLFKTIPQLTTRKSINGKTTSLFLKIFRLVATILLIIHYTSCIWWYVGENINPSWMDKETVRDLCNFEKYTYSLYFATTLKFVKATNVFEQWITILHTLLGTAILSYFIGTLSSMISQGNRENHEREIIIQEAQYFCDRNELPKKMTRAILSHVKYHCKYNTIFDENRVLNIIPTHLANEVSKQIAKKIIDAIVVDEKPLFEDLDEHVRGLMGLKIKAISCNTDHSVFKPGDIANKVYIQRTGESTLENHQHNEIHQFKRGDVCGESAIIDHQSKRTSKLKCATWSEFYVLHVEDILEILKNEYPENWQQKLEQIKNRLHSIDKHPENAYVQAEQKSNDMKYNNGEENIAKPKMEVQKQHSKQNKQRRLSVTTLQNNVPTRMRSKSAKRDEEIKTWNQTKLTEHIAEDYDNDTLSELDENDETHWMEKNKKWKHKYKSVSAIFSNEHEKSNHIEPIDDDGTITFHI
eukprot:78536_1